MLYQNSCCTKSRNQTTSPYLRNKSCRGCQVTEFQPKTSNQLSKPGTIQQRRIRAGPGRAGCSRGGWQWLSGDRITPSLPLGFPPVQFHTVCSRLLLRQ